MSARPIIYLSIIQILAIHDRIIEQFGGSHGLQNIDLLESAISRPQSGFGKADLYQSIFEKAAALFHSLLKNHPFIDGNKRTALTSTGIFLLLNGYELDTTDQEELTFTIRIDTENLKVGDIVLWLERNCRRLI